MQAAALRRALAQAEREEMELAILKATYIHIDDIRDVFAPMISNAKQKLYQIEDRLLPRLPGNPVDNARTIRQAIDELCSELQYADPKPKRRRGRKAVAPTPAE
jgi:Mg2+ and Co2+ transporter CorA